MLGGRGRLVRAALHFLNDHPDNIQYRADALWSINERLGQLISLLLRFFWWRGSTRPRVAGVNLELFGDGYLRDLLAQEKIDKDYAPVASDSDDAPRFPGNTDEEGDFEF